MFFMKEPHLAQVLDLASLRKKLPFYEDVFDK